MDQRVLALRKIQEISEAAFTNQVLVPLFIRLGYKVDYHGGPAEGGKDLICWKEGEFGSSELTVVQVKKTKPSAAAGTANAFSGIVNQLQQASEKPVPNLHGFSQRPTTIYFVTPYEIDTRALESRFEGMVELRSRGVRVLDGRLVLDAVSKHAPELIDALCGDTYVIQRNLLGNLSNADLLSALNYAKEKNVFDFYCDLDFGVGKITTKSFFSMAFAPKETELKLSAARWQAFEDTANEVEAFLGVEIVVPPILEVVETFERKHAQWQSSENQELLKRISRSVEYANDALETIIYGCGQAISDALSSRLEFDSLNRIVENENRPTLTQEEAERLHALRKENSLKVAELTEWYGMGEDPKRMPDVLSSVCESVTSHLRSIEDEVLISNNLKAKILASGNADIGEILSRIPLLQDDIVKRVAEPAYMLTLSGGALAEALEAQRKWMVAGMDALSSKRWSPSQIRDFFLRCQSLYGIVGGLMESKFMVEALGAEFPKNSLVSTSARISMPLRDVFETGINCAIFGDAGAGKSTTLFNFAATASNSGNEQDIALFLPLTRVLSEVVLVGDDINISPLAKLERGIIGFLRLSKSTSSSEVIAFLNGKRRVTFIFDGVDEVIKAAPWIIQAISELEGSYSNSQILLSSRMSGSYVGGIKYLGLTLLPFTDDQVRSFVDGWFKDAPERAKNVNDHLLSTPILAEIVRNPLLATILCVLAGNDVPLPAGELSMYDERLKLLLGHYDIHKKTRRITSHHSLLEVAARRLAYHLHNKNQRFASLEYLEGAAVALLAKSYAGATEQQVRMAVRELVDPCNILEPMTEVGEFGFGHLRYQEHLCASELRQNRGIDLMPLLESSWWRSVLVLFTRMTDDVNHIISDVIEEQSNFSRIKENLMAMIATRPPYERRQLTKLVEQHEKLDEDSRNLKEYFDFDNDADDADPAWGW